MWYNKYMENKHAKEILTLAFARPDIAKQWHPTMNGALTPSNVSKGSSIYVWWQCDKYDSHFWKTQVAVRTRKLSAGCSICAGKTVLAGFNDFESQSPELAKQWHPTRNILKPSEVMQRSSKKYWWLCNEGHSFEARLSSRAQGEHGCPYCTNHIVLTGFNDLYSINPELAKQWHPKLNGDITAEHVIATSPSKHWWLGACGHEWEAKIMNRAAGTGCPYCTGNKVLSGFNDFKSLRPDTAKEWHASKNGTLKPDMVAYSSNKKVWWEAECGHEWFAAISNRYAGTGCPTCSKGGFSAAEPSIFYFIHNYYLNARKIGITNKNAKRIKYWLGQGWILVHSIHSDAGYDINSLETVMKRWIKKEHNLHPVLTSEQIGSRGGWSETFTAGVLTNEEIIEKIDIEWYKLNI